MSWEQTASNGLRIISQSNQRATNQPNLFDEISTSVERIEKRRRLLAQLEERIAGGLSRQLAEIDLVAERIRRLEAMTDRQYVSLMLYLPDLSDDEVGERSATVNRRYEAWRRAVDKLLNGSKRSS